MKNIPLKYLVASLFIALLAFNKNLKAAEITEQSFLGQWVGQWDQVYRFCLWIDSLEDGAEAIYHWQEQPKGHFSHGKKTIKRINRNTIKMENILLILDPEDPKLAMALGIFKTQSRRSFVLKKAAATTSCDGQ